MEIDRPDPKEYYDSDQFADAKTEVSSYLEGVGEARIRDFNRVFPQHTRRIFDILESLRIDGKVYYDEWRPAPLTFYAGDRTLKPTPQRTSIRSHRRPAARRAEPAEQAA